MEIVIENPVESSPPPPPLPPPPPPPPPLPPPPPPPPPPPLQQQQQPTMMPPWSVIATPPASSSSSTNVAASMPAVTTVMTITIAENPPASPAYPAPVRFSYRETYAATQHPFAGDPYCARRGPPRGRPYSEPDATSPMLRRVDKSGLLGVAETDATGSKVGSRSPRFLPAAGTPSSVGMLSPSRRFECPGQLDPVPEVPGQPTRGNLTPTAVVCGGPSMLIGRGEDRTGECQLDRGETLSVVDLARPMKSASFDSLEPRRRIDRADVGSMLLQAFDRDLDGKDSPDPAAPFLAQQNCDVKARTLGRLSRLAMARNDHGNGPRVVDPLGRRSETCCSFPFSVRATPVFPGFDATSGLPSTRATTTAGTASTTTVAASATTKQITCYGDGTARKEAEADGSDGVRLPPEEERAEAEGCEHGSSRSPLKGEEAADNDGIQTLRVIILSEQL